jgi:hypothetical protein
MLRWTFAWLHLEVDYDNNNFLFYDELSELLIGAAIRFQLWPVEPKSGL